NGEDLPPLPLLRRKARLRKYCGSVVVVAVALLVMFLRLFVGITGLSIVAWNRIRSLFLRLTGHKTRIILHHRAGSLTSAPLIFTAGRTRSTPVEMSTVLSSVSCIHGHYGVRARSTTGVCSRTGYRLMYVAPFVPRIVSGYIVDWWRNEREEPSSSGEL